MEEHLHKCDNCEKTYKEDELAEIHDFWSRVSPGSIVPSGDCPECYALCYPIDREKSPSGQTRIVILRDGGRIEEVFSEVSLDFAVLDPETEGCDETEIKMVTVYLEPEEVWFDIRGASVDPERVKRIFDEIG